jgi:hypothetical protein
MIKKARFARKGPDFLTEELATVLSTETSFDFNGLFQIVQINLRERSVARGDKEMFRLRTYEKLQNMVQSGVVIRDGKTYRADRRKLPAFRERLAADHAARLQLQETRAAESRTHQS